MYILELAASPPLSVFFENATESTCRSSTPPLTAPEPNFCLRKIQHVSPIVFTSIKSSQAKSVKTTSHHYSLHSPLFVGHLPLWGATRRLAPASPVTVLVVVGQENHDHAPEYTPSRQHGHQQVLVDFHLFQRAQREEED